MDIKLTLSTKKNRAPSIEAERSWLDKEGSLCYPVGPNTPNFAEPGSSVFFIREGKLQARGRILRFTRAEQRYDYSGGVQNPSGIEVEVVEMEIAKTPFEHKGFQGFRYVQPSEQTEFEAAFGSNA